MKTKIFLACLLVSVLTVLPLAAQASLIGDNTYTLFSSDIDAFMDPNDYETVEFSESFSELQYAADFSGLSGFNSDFIAAGHARNLGGTYVGLFFEGNPYEGTITDGTVDYLAYDSLSVLVGTESIGALKFYGLYFGVKDSTSNTNTKLYGFGGGWGKNFVLGNGTVFKPEINLMLLKTGGDTNFLGIVAPGASGGVTGLDYAFVLAGTADWELTRTGSAARTAVFDYGLVVLPGNDDTLVLNTFGAGIKYVFDITERFSVGVGALLSLGVGVENMKVLGTSSTTTMVSLSPEGIAGFTYRFNSPFSVNAGITIKDGGFGYLSNDSTTELRVNGYGVETKAGMLFQPNENFSIDFAFVSPNVNNGYSRQDYYQFNLSTFKAAATFRK